MSRSTVSSGDPIRSKGSLGLSTGWTSTGMVSSKTPGGSAPGRDAGDLDPIGRLGELGLDRRARRRVAVRDPCVPYRVHLGECGHIGEINGGGKEPGLVRSCFGEEALDR